MKIKSISPAPYCLALSLLTTVSLAGCGGQSVQGHHPQARSLYRQSVRIGNLYMDSLKKAADSVTVNRLMSDYLERIDKLNFQYPPDTDLEMTEGENDTLSILASRLVRLKAKKLKEFSVREEAPSSHSSGNQSQDGSAD